MSDHTTTGLPTSVDEQVDLLVDRYGTGVDATGPTATQWRRLLGRPAGEPVTLINLFRLRDQARYPDGHPLAGAGLTGAEALARYSGVSVPTAERHGVRFLLLGPVAGTWIGAEEHWDLVAVGAYPDASAVLGLCLDPGYRDAFTHRVAACERQQVLLCGA